jgi:arylsulfatase A-like enzyme
MGVALVTPRRSRPFPRRPLALAAAAIVVGVVAAVMSGILSPWYYAVTMRRPPRPLDVPDPRPRFLWVLLFDPHTPYDPPEPFRSRHAGRPYDGEIAYMDSQLRRLLEAARGTGRDWLTVVAGDHGEELGDHDELTHVYPPTMLELAALPGLDGVDGRSLVDAIAGRPALHGPVYMESYHPRDWWGAAEITALRTAEWLFVDRRGPSSTTSSPTLVSAPISPSAGGKSWPNFARR